MTAQKNSLTIISFVSILLIVTAVIFYSPENNNKDGNITYLLEKCTDTSISLDIHVGNDNGAYFNIKTLCPDSSEYQIKKIMIDGKIENLILKINGIEIKK